MATRRVRTSSVAAQTYFKGPLGGARGPTGTGDTGATGATGPTGDPGPTGPPEMPEMSIRQGTQGGGLVHSEELADATYKSADDGFLTEENLKICREFGVDPHNVPRLIDEIFRLKRLINALEDEAQALRNLARTLAIANTPKKEA